MLKGLGASLALPLLETMGWAETPKAGGYKPPVRMAFIYVPHGVNHDHFWPTEGKLGASSTLPSILEPLRSVINDVLVLGGLDHRAEIDDRGHHASETATWLSGVAAKRDKIEAGISVDQLAAQKIGMYTVLPSMELALHQGKSVIVVLIIHIFRGVRQLSQCRESLIPVRFSIACFSRVKADRIKAVMVHRWTLNNLPLRAVIKAKAHHSTKACSI